LFDFDQTRRWKKSTTSRSYTNYMRCSMSGIRFKAYNTFFVKPVRN